MSPEVRAAHLSADIVGRARALLELYPHPRSALIPICHLAQEQDGWLTPQAIDEIAELVGLSPAEVLGTASFYEMLHTEPVGRYVVSVCTNIACMLQGAYELLDHIQDELGHRGPGRRTRRRHRSRSRRPSASPTAAAPRAWR